MRLLSVCWVGQTEATQFGVADDFELGLERVREGGWLDLPPQPVSRRVRVFVCLDRVSWFSVRDES